jgi:hypothetical protein
MQFCSFAVIKSCSRAVREPSELGIRCSLFDIILRKKTLNIEHRIMNTEDVLPNSLTAYSLTAYLK